MPREIWVCHEHRGNRRKAEVRSRGRRDHGRRSAAPPAGPSARWRSPRPRPRTARSPPPPHRSASNAATILAENAKDVADMKKAGGSAAFLDRLTLTEARIEAMAKGLEEIAAPPRPGRHRDRRMGPAERPPHRARAHAARRHRHHLREPPERHRRRRRALPQGRQCRDPARRLGFVPLLDRDPPLPRRGPDRRRPAGRGDPDRPHPRPRRRRRDARRARRQSST